MKKADLSRAVIAGTCTALGSDGLSCASFDLEFCLDGTAEDDRLTAT